MPAKNHLQGERCIQVGTRYLQVSFLRSILDDAPQTTPHSPFYLPCDAVADGIFPVLM